MGLARVVGTAVLALLQLPALTIQLNHNQDSQGLTEVPSGIPVTTTNLYLRFNSIASIDDQDLETLTELKYLYMQDNLLADVSTGAFNFTNKIVFINFQKNSLTKVPYLKVACATLKEIHLNNNDLTSILCGDFEGCSVLNTLFAEQNEITFVEKCAFEGTNMQRLWLGNNQLTSIPYVGDIAGSLWFLKLDQNFITQINDTDVAGLSLLSRLYLNKNNLVNISVNAFDGTALNELKLDDNELTYIPYLLNVNTTLEKLYISLNLISTISEEDLRGLGDLTTLDLSGQLQLICCDSRVEWLKNWSGLILDTGSEFPCAEPEALQTTLWSAITFEDLRQPCPTTGNRVNVLCFN